jgi:hypothetical protein
VNGPAADASTGFLNTPIPVLQQLAPLLGIAPPTILDLSGYKNEFNPFFANVQQIADFAASLTNTLAKLGADGRPITIGCLEYYFDPDSGQGQLIPCQLKSLIDSIDLSDFLMLPDYEWDPGGFIVDILTPQSITNMILGQPFDLVSYNLPKFDFALGSTFGFDWKLLEFDVNATATVNVGGDDGIGFVYDLTGLESVVAAARAGAVPDNRELLKGFYIRTDAEDPELSLNLSVGGSGGVDVKVLSVSANVALNGNVDFEIRDPNGDGQVRLSEIYKLTDNFNNPQKLINLFDTGVNVAGSYSISGEIGISPFSSSIDVGDLGIPTGFSVNLQLSDIIGSFMEVPVDPAPVLATEIIQNGRRVLRINAGPYAAARAFGNTTDGDENFTVSGTVGAIQVQYNDGTQIHSSTYAGSYAKIIVLGGDGSDTLNFAGAGSIPVELFGGDGDDMLLGGNAGD